MSGEAATMTGQKDPNPKADTVPAAALNAVVREVQAFFAGAAPAGKLLSEELLADCRQEAAKEGGVTRPVALPAQATQRRGADHLVPVGLIYAGRKGERLYRRCRGRSVRSACVASGRR